MTLEISKIKSSGAKKKYPRLTDGTHLARIYQVVDLGMQERTDWETKEPTDPKNMVMVSWEIPGETIEIEEEDGTTTTKPKVISKEYVLSTHEKAGLMKLLGAIAPKATSLAELLNVPCMLQIGSTSTGNAKVANVMACPAGIDVKELFNESVFFDFDNFDQGLFDTLYNWQQEKIKSALNWKEPAEEKSAKEDPDY